MRPQDKNALRQQGEWISKELTILGRILYIMLGFMGSLAVFSLAIPWSQHFTVLDLWRFFVSPGIVSLIAATFGARAGAQSNIRASEEDLARTYWSLLDLASEDIRINMNIMLRVRAKIRTVEKEGRKPVFYELEPQQVHTMFFEDIEYPKLRKIVTGNGIEDIFRVRNVKYVFDRWNTIVSKYYVADKPLVHDEGEAEIIKYLTVGTPGDNFIVACETALMGIRRIQAQITAHEPVA
jgi:hypothetical protein